MYQVHRVCSLVKVLHLDRQLSHRLDDQSQLCIFISLKTTPLKFTHHCWLKTCVWVTPFAKLFIPFGIQCRNALESQLIQIQGAPAEPLNGHL